MNKQNGAIQNFLMNRDETGKFLVKSIKTGRVYFVEPIHDGKIVKWGDIDPAAKKMTGSYGKKYTGAVSKKESVITSENGFSNISIVIGSPFVEIERREQAFLNKR